MADVRLTATNPEDSSVVPVACDASGRLLLEEQGVGPQGPPGPQGDPGQDGQDGDPFSGNFAGDVTFGGSASFAGDVMVSDADSVTSTTTGGTYIADYGQVVVNSVSDSPSNERVFLGKNKNVTTSEINADGSAEFVGITSTPSTGAAIYAYNGGTSSENAILISNASDGSGLTTFLKYDGSAEFAADVTINGVNVGLGGSSEATNTAVGNVALEDNTTGRENTAVGRAALQLTTEGSFNCAFGNFALQRNTEGERNTSVGRTALHLNVSGDANTAVGQNALTSNTAGNYNTVVGQNAGYHIQGNNNTILGSYEGTAADAFLNDTVLISAGREWRMVSDALGVTEFSADVVVGSRSKKWMLVEQNGLCHMVEQVRATNADLVGSPRTRAVEYPQLRDVFAELDVVERALEEVMVKLRMAQPSGWPVWDGSDEISEDTGETSTDTP